MNSNGGCGELWLSFEWVRAPKIVFAAGRRLTLAVGFNPRSVSEQTRVASATPEFNRR